MAVVDKTVNTVNKMLAPVVTTPKINKTTAPNVNTAVIAPPPKPPLTAPILNGANDTSGNPPALGYGSVVYGSSPEANAALKANKALISTEAGRSSETTRSLSVVDEINRALALDPNNPDLLKRLDNANRYLTNDLGYKAPISEVLGPPPGDNGGFTGAEYQNDINSQIRAYQQQIESAKLAAQYGVDTNNQFLSDQLAGMATDKAIADDSAQQLQNRRGGFYSGGLDYQQGGIQRVYDANKGALTRDIAGRNQQLLDQYGSQANAISGQIRSLQSAAPGIIADKILDYKIKTAGLTGTFNGEKTRDAMESDRTYDREVGRDTIDDTRYTEETTYNRGRDTKADERYDQESALDNAYKQADVTGVIGPVLGKLYGLPANTPTQSAKESNRNYDLNRRSTEANIENLKADNARLSAPKDSSGGNPKMPAKESANNAADIRSQIISEKLNRADALLFLQGNADVITDSDYNKLMTYINSLK